MLVFKLADVVVTADIFTFYLKLSDFSCKPGTKRDIFVVVQNVETRSVLGKAHPSLFCGASIMGCVAVSFIIRFFNINKDVSDLCVMLMKTIC